MGDKPGALKKYFRPTDCVRRALFCLVARQVCGTSLQPCGANRKYGEAFPQVFQVNRKGCQARRKYCEAFWKPCKAAWKYCGAFRKGCKASQKYCGRLPPVSGALQKVSEAILTVSGVVLPVSFALRNASLVTGAPGPEHGCPQPQRVADRKTGKIFRDVRRHSEVLRLGQPRSAGSEAQGANLGIAESPTVASRAWPRAPPGAPTSTSALTKQTALLLGWNRKPGGH